MLQDLRFTFRLMFKERWYTAVIVLVLALGIGVNATGFTIVNAAFLRGPAFTDAHELLFLSWQPNGRMRSDISYPELQDWRAQSQKFEAIAAVDELTVTIGDDQAAAQQARGAAVTLNAFEVLQLQPFLGRGFAPGEDLRGANPVVILSYRLWITRYGSDSRVLGSPVRLNGQPATIIGVMPDNMNFPVNAELWTVFIPSAEQEQRTARVLTAFGRLRDGATVEEARTELDGIAQRLAAEYPDANKNLIGGRVETFTERFVGGSAGALFPAIMAAAAFVLLVACANVANLLLARSASRGREIAVRVAVGASRARVLRQLLMESIVLGCMGGAAGLLLAYGGVRALDAAMSDPGKPYWIIFNMDYTVLAYVAGICILTGVLFGFAPALHISKANLNEVMKQSGRGTAGTRRVRWFSASMVVVELALTMVLLVGAGLMIRSFVKLYTMDVGIRTEHLMSMRLQLPASRYTSPESRYAFFSNLESRVASTPGVQTIALTTHVPPFGSEFRAFTIEGRPAATSDAQTTEIAAVTISPRFFEAVGAAVRRGRAFNEADGATGAESVIINEPMAAKFFPGEDPIGRRLRFKDSESWRMIVGISPSIRHERQQIETTPVVYLPHRQESPPNLFLIVRSSLPPASVMNAVRDEVRLFDPDQPVFTIQTVDQMLEQSRWGHRTFGTIFAVFAAIALILSAVGLYAVMAYAVTQRTLEIGVRMALGAQAHEVSWLILKRGLVQLAIGLILGVAGGVAVSRVFRGMLVQIAPTDPLTFVAIIVVLTAVAVAACVVPARRATRIDPLIAIRAD